MADEKNPGLTPREIAYWKKQIKTAVEKKDKALSVYETALEYCKGNQFTTDQISEANAKDKRLTYVNMVKAWRRIVLGTLYYRNPKILVKKSGKGSSQGAKMLQAIANYYVRELNLEQVNKDIIGTALFCPIAGYKIGYNTIIGEETVVEPGEDFISKMLPTFGQLINHIPKPVVTKVNEFVKAESVFCYDFEPKDIIVDPMATSQHDARWFGHILHKRAIDVQNSTLYYNKDRIVALRKLKEGEDGEANDEIVTLYELHIKEQNDKGQDKIRVLVLTDSSDVEHRNGFSPYSVEGFNFGALQFNKLKDGQFYPESLFKDIRPIQDNKNLVRSNMLTLIDKFFARVLYDSERIKDTGALKDGGFAALVPVKGAPAGAVELALQNVFPTDLYNMEDRIDQDFTIVSTITKSKMVGISDAKTLGEAQIGEGGSNISLDDLANDVDNFLILQAKKLIQIIKTMVPFATIQKICEQLEAEGVKAVVGWKEIPEEEIKADYDVTIEVGSARPPNVEVKRQQDMEWLTLLSNLKTSGILADEGRSITLSPLLEAMIYDADLADGDMILVDNTDIQMTPELLQILATPQMQALIMNPATRALFSPKLLAMIDEAAKAEMADQAGAGAKQPGIRGPGPGNPEKGKPENIKRSVKKKAGVN